MFLQGDFGGKTPHCIDKIDIQAVVEVFSLQGSIGSHTRLAAEEAGKEISQVADPTGPKIRPTEIEAPEPGSGCRTPVAQAKPSWPN
jgi:hypothetical protein